jgi:hypothetical protein
MDRVCVKMPDNFRDFLIAMAVLQDYGVRLAIGAQRKQRDMHYEVTFRMNEKYSYFAPCLQVIKENVPIFDYTGWSEQVRGEFDNFIDFNKDHIRELTYVFPEAHLTEGFGILIGTGALGVITGIDIPKWPVLTQLNLPGQKTISAVYPQVVLEHSRLDSKKVSVAVLIWDATESQRFFSFLCKNYPDLDIHLSDTPDDPEILCNYLNNFDIVVGYAGAATYLAASLDKAVLEIFPNREEALLYNSMEIKVYQALLGVVNAEFMMTAWEELWLKFQEHISITSKGESTPMVQEVSSVESADVKS